jgi:hypothetical protein
MVPAGRPPKKGSAAWLRKQQEQISNKNKSSTKEKKLK